MRKKKELHINCFNHDIVGPKMWSYIYTFPILHYDVTEKQEMQPCECDFSLFDLKANVFIRVMHW